MRFLNVEPIPAGNIITKATLKIFVGDADDVNCDIYAHKVAHPPSGGSGTPIHLRARTLTSIPWVQDNLGTFAWREVDVTLIIQELVDAGLLSAGGSYRIVDLKIRR